MQLLAERYEAARLEGRARLAAYELLKVSAAPSKPTNAALSLNSEPRVCNSQNMGCTLLLSCEQILLAAFHETDGGLCFSPAVEAKTDPPGGGRGPGLRLSEACWEYPAQSPPTERPRAGAGFLEHQGDAANPEAFTHTADSEALVPAEPEPADFVSHDWVKPPTQSQNSAASLALQTSAASMSHIMAAALASLPPPQGLPPQRPTSAASPSSRPKSSASPGSAEQLRREIEVLALQQSQQHEKQRRWRQQLRRQLEQEQNDDQHQLLTEAQSSIPAAAAITSVELVEPLSAHLQPPRHSTSQMLAAQQQALQAQCRLWEGDQERRQRRELRRLERLQHSELAQQQPLQHPQSLAHHDWVWGGAAAEPVTVLHAYQSRQRLDNPPQLGASWAGWVGAAALHLRHAAEEGLGPGQTPQHTPKPSEGRLHQIVAPSLNTFDAGCASATPPPRTLILAACTLPPEQPPATPNAAASHLGSLQKAGQEIDAVSGNNSFTADEAFLTAASGEGTPGSVSGTAGDGILRAALAEEAAAAVGALCDARVHALAARFQPCDSPRREAAALLLRAAALGVLQQGLQTAAATARGAPPLPGAACEDPAVRNAAGDLEAALGRGRLTELGALSLSPLADAVCSSSAVAELEARIAPLFQREVRHSAL